MSIQHVLSGPPARPQPRTAADGARLDAKADPARSPGAAVAAAIATRIALPTGEVR
ncbi:hypothetical protein [uncultured Albimonas sp.]|uniref:hypothetical protein n=1 Tax=uncultured Albimonas sp. TaxID=1331701 RepID=UPI0030EB2063|tara:strand:- start:1796 stop:1963 length:168 start_codon:yes stop_codon:yes gene_type:complete